MRTRGCYNFYLGNYSRHYLFFAQLVISTINKAVTHLLHKNPMSIHFIFIKLS